MRSATPWICAAMSKGANKTTGRETSTKTVEHRPPRFLADAMLIRLARWLRVLDFDTVCLPQAPDRDLVATADREGRWLLTRDRALIRELKPDRFVLIDSQHPLNQLAEVVEACRLRKPRTLFRRCLLCNSPLRSATAEEIALGVPPQARRCNDEILHCPGCGRNYWAGSHTRRMENALRRSLPEWFDEVR